MDRGLKISEVVLIPQKTQKEASALKFQTCVINNILEPILEIIYIIYYLYC